MNGKDAEAGADEKTQVSADSPGDGPLDDGQLDAVSGGVRHADMTITKKHDISSGSL